ncbi:ATP-binding cassette domain-containing protein [Nitratireductor sp. CAU 1489]|uniref:ATP-binding cassette domain-containing protein n=1 Tax=Nitratireductor arenosus TaxID=2682096 RepID=A0A844QIJ7_9HYPH|nr:phosphate ABC transporter ATP-binding protein [Nitratireductor arenosus]MVA97878.1 ATP-binding cassette domain-containing protein [Nitratireductor arenosus]
MNIQTTGAAKAVPPPGRGEEGRIRVENVNVAYGAIKALSDVTLSIPPRRITALIGPSGCGKTSLLTCVNRLIDLIPGANATGRIFLRKTDVLARDADLLRLRKRVGMVFQKPNPFPFSIRRNFDIVLTEFGVRRRDDREKRIDECLRAVGLHTEIGHRLDMSACALSGGQQQRLCIARALATRPEILLLDEPCSALDPMSTMTIERLLLDLKDSVTLVIVTHNLSQARRIADECALFWTECGTGYLLEHGTMADLTDRPKNQVTADYLHGRVA